MGKVNEDSLQMFWFPTLDLVSELKRQKCATLPGFLQFKSNRKFGLGAHYRMKPMVLTSLFENIPNFITVLI